jgi:hypothetical protein
LFLLSAVAFSSAGMLVAAACTFPEPQLVPDEGGALDTSTSTSSSGGETDGADNRGGCVCDCDEDGYIDVDANPVCDAGGNKRDCDDFDRRANPDAGFLADLPTTDTKGDWNCDGTTIREVPAINVDCTTHSVLDCNTTEGFAGDPECGEDMTCVHCTWKNIACAIGTNEVRTQRCK